MDYETVKNKCHVRSAIYRKSNVLKKYYKNNPLPFDMRVSEEDKLATDWEEYDPRDDDNSSLHMYND